jgi:hypothetical protein
MGDRADVVERGGEIAAPRSTPRVVGIVGLVVFFSGIVGTILLGFRDSLWGGIDPALADALLLPALIGGPGLILVARFLWVKEERRKRGG